MSGWHSLSGYLQYKSGNALGRLITKRKVWCVLEENKCQLHYYKSEEEMHKQRQSQGHIDINGAAISLDLENQNQFVVLSDGKEHYFTAENHESMMIWLLGLQAKRDIYCKKATVLSENDDSGDTFRDRTNSDLSIWNNRPSHIMAYPIHPAIDDCDAIQSPKFLTPKSFKWEKYESHKWGESVDSGLSLYSKRPLEPTKSFPIQTSKSVPLTLKSLAPTGLSSSVPAQHSSPGKMRVRKHYSGTPKLSGSPTTSTGSFDDSDDVFDECMKQRKQQHISRNWRKVQSAVVTQRLPYSPPMDVWRESRYSSRSTSSDSAIDTASPLELANRLSELETELISTKCELAKVMNQQTCYQELLQQKEQAIKGLEKKVGSSHMNGSLKKEVKISSPKRTKSEKELQEKIRVLKNQNRFLNEEVKKLAKIRLQEHNKYQEQNLKLHSLEAEIEKWKMDYVTLIQSSIRFPGQEGTEDMELCLYGGDKHRNRVRSLLDEARKINPRLPTYDSLANGEVHVDSYGFKHVYTSSGLLLHYLCTELTHHYLAQAGVYEEHQKQWTFFMRQNGKSPMKETKELKTLCRGGIPDRFRKQMWRHLVHHHVRDLMVEKGDYYYRNLCNMLPESPLASCYRKQVSLDLMRSMPGNTKFSAQGSKGIMDLQDVLLAFCIHNPTIGYCQGMNFIVGMALIFMDAQDAFWTLVAVAERYFSPHYFDHNLIGAQSDQQVLKDMVKEKLPDLYNHLDSIDIELSTITLNWFLAVFFDAVPFQTLLRIWDCFLLEGPKVLFRFALGILKLHEKDILQKTDTMGIMKHLKACAKLTYDVEGLVKLAFEGLRPFPKRRDITTKQTCYLNALKEKHKKKELQRLAFAEREQLYMSMEAEAGIFMGIECAVTGPDGKVWLCYGDQNIGRLSCVSCEQGHMTSLEWKLDSRLMCMCSMSPDKLALGTISWMLLAFNVTTRDQEWQIQLHDAILSLCCYEDETMTTRIFSGLADGTVAVVEQAYRKTEPSMDVLYIPIGQAPVTCLMIQGEQLWCASGNTVAILHAKSLDTLDTLSVSVNPYDHILSLVPGDYGIWITLRGSSILELWDPKALCCRMLYDTRTDRYPHLKKEDDVYFNRARITSILANGNTVWVGTGEGNLIIYEILESSQIKTPTVRSPSTENLSSIQSGGTFRAKEDELLKEITTKDIKAKLLNVNCNPRRCLEHYDSMEVNFNPNSPSPVNLVSGLSQNCSDYDDEDAYQPKTTQYAISDANQELIKDLEKAGGKEASADVNSEHENIGKDEKRDTTLKRRASFASEVHKREDSCESSDSKPLRFLKRESSESCIHVGRNSVELGEQENPLEQVYEADARSSFSHELIEPMEVEDLQNMCSLQQQNSKKRGSRPSLVKLKSESNILIKKKEEQIEYPDLNPEESAFEAKMEEYARRKSSSYNLVEQEDFDRIQAIYDQTMEAQTKGSRHSPVEGAPETAMRKFSDHEMSEPGTSFKNNPSPLLERAEFERLQSMYEEAVGKHTREAKKSIERRRTFSSELNPCSPSIAEENEYSVEMETIKGDAADNQTQPEIKPSSRELFNKERRSSSESDLSLRLRIFDDSPESQTIPQRKTSVGKQWSRERRRSSSENDLLIVHQPCESIECQGRSESLIKCNPSERKEEMYEEKLEQAALRETFKNCQLLSAYYGQISPSSCELILSPDSEVSGIFEQFLAGVRMLGKSEAGTMVESDTSCKPLENEIQYYGRHGNCLALLEGQRNKAMNNSNQEDLDRKDGQKYVPVNLWFEYCDSCSVEILGNENSSDAVRKANLHIKDASRKTQLMCKKCGKSLPIPNGVSDRLKERLLQNYHHSEANLDLKEALEVLNCHMLYKSAELQKQERNTKMVNDGTDSPGRGQRSMSDGINLLRGVEMPWGRARASSLQRNTQDTGHYNEMCSADTSDKEITQEEKVGLWLSSISSEPDISSSEAELKFSCAKRVKGSNDIKTAEISPESNSEDDVFLSAKEKDPDSNSDSQLNRQNHSGSKSSLMAVRKAEERKLRTDSSESETKTDKSFVSSRNSSSRSDKNLKNKDADAQYRLEFSGIHVETDHESEKEQKVQKPSADVTSFTKMAKIGNSDRRKSSLDLGSIQEKCNRFYETFMNKIGAMNLHEVDEMPLRISDRHKLFEYLRTPSLESRQLSIGPKILEDDLDWTDVFTPQYSTHSPSSSADHRMADFLKTPSLSSRQSSRWSSYENISTPTEQENRYLCTIHHRGHLSHSASTGSISSETGVIYNVDLTMEAKMKISDKPVKCLLPTSVQGEPLILSCSGSYGDDEAVLKWRKHVNELLWTNEPILEFCPKTKMKILPTYMRRRLSSTSSFQSHGSEESITTYLSSSSHK